MGIITTDSKPFLIWERHWIEEWNDLDISDKKVLAALYWFDLTQKQKEEFSDNERIEFLKIKEAKKKEIASDPSKLKAHFITEAAPLLDMMIESAINGKDLGIKNQFAVSGVWDLLKDAILSAKTAPPLINIKGKSVEGQIDEILSQVSRGDIGFDEAKEYMALVSSGYNLQTLPKLIAKLESLEGS